MLKLKMRYGKVISLVIVMMMAISVMFVLPSSAHDDDHLHESEMYFILLDDNGVPYIVTSLEQEWSCGCSNPDRGDYRTDSPNHPYRTTDHFTPFISLCFNCKRSKSNEAICIGGCGQACNLPYFSEEIQEQFNG